MVLLLRMLLLMKIVLMITVVLPCCTYNNIQAYGIPDSVLLRAEELGEQFDAVCRGSNSYNSSSSSSSSNSSNTFSDASSIASSDADGHGNASDRY